MDCRPLNHKERKCVEQVLSPYGCGNYPLQGGSMTMQENGNITYFLDIGGVEPLGIQTKKIGKNLKELLGADEIYIQSVKVV